MATIPASYAGVENSSKRRSPGAVHKGLAIATDTAGVTRLYATNFAPARWTGHDDVPGQNHDIVNPFHLDGSMPQRFAQHGQLNSPWGMALAPARFGALAGALWIGNFGNGHIDAYDPITGELIDKVRDANGHALVIDGLWSLKVGNGGYGGNGGLANTLYFGAGTNGEQDGLFGSLTPK